MNEEEGREGRETTGEKGRMGFGKPGMVAVWGMWVRVGGKCG